MEAYEAQQKLTLGPDVLIESDSRRLSFFFRLQWRSPVRQVRPAGCRPLQPGQETRPVPSPCTAKCAHRHADLYADVIWHLLHKLLTGTQPVHDTHLEDRSGVASRVRVSGKVRLC